MKTLKNIFLTIVLVCVSIVTFAGSFLVKLKSGETHEVAYSNRTLTAKGVELNDGQIIEYIKVSGIDTDNFDAYEKATRRAKKNGSRHIKVEYTGSDNAKLLKLEKLEKKRTGAHAARATGGILAIIGAVSGDRDLYAAGMVTYGAGTVSRDINTEKTIETQNEMLKELHENQQKQQEESPEEQYRKQYGNENYDAVVAVVDKNHKKALALVNVALLSENEEQRISATYIKALVAADMNDAELLEQAKEEMVEITPELTDTAQAQEEVDLMIEQLNNLRNG